jgi:hypothetical protein
MNGNATPKPKSPSPTAAGNVPAAPDARDATIARLERELAEEKKVSATLRAASEQARFQLQILEKSYAKQLRDARELAGTTGVAAKKPQAAAPDAGVDIPKLLKDTRAELARVTAERDELRAQLARGSSYKPERTRREEPHVADGGTINALLIASSGIRERKPADGLLDKKVGVEDDSPSIDLLDPSLVFTKGKRDDDD